MPVAPLVDELVLCEKSDCLGGDVPTIIKGRAVSANVWHRFCMRTATGMRARQRLRACSSRFSLICIGHC
jgi:hypothetical protein